MPGSGTFADSGVGSSTITMLSQNAALIRKNMTLPCVLHGIFTAVEDTLAEPFEGEVRWVLSILRMFDASFRRAFLKFERFSSLRKRCQPLARCAWLRRHALTSNESVRQIGRVLSADACEPPWCRPHSATDRSPFGTKPNAGTAVFAHIAFVQAPAQRSLSVRLSGL